MKDRTRIALELAGVVCLAAGAFLAWGLGAALGVVGVVAMAEANVDRGGDE